MSLLNRGVGPVQLQTAAVGCRTQADQEPTPADSDALAPCYGHRMYALAVSLALATAPGPARFADVVYGMGEERDVVVDGFRVHIAEAGPKDGPPVLLLHCFGLSMKVWRDTVPALVAAGFHVVAYDAPGHGKSARGVRALRLIDLADLAVGVMDALGLESAAVVGNSMGGGTALTLAIEHPERVSKLVLVDSVGLDFRPWFRPLWGMMNPSAAQHSPDWAWGIVYDLAVQKQSALGVDIRADLLSTRADPLADRAAQAFYTVIVDVLKTDRTPDLRRVQASTLVVAGAHDRLVHPDHAVRLHEGILGSRLLVYDDLGHLPEVEDAARVSRDLVAFLMN